MFERVLRRPSNGALIWIFRNENLYINVNDNISVVNKLLKYLVFCKEPSSYVILSFTAIFLSSNTHQTSHHFFKIPDYILNCMTMVLASLQHIPICSE